MNVTAISPIYKVHIYKISIHIIQVVSSIDQHVKFYCLLILVKC